jgi:hypothetical protein
MERRPTKSLGWLLAAAVLVLFPDVAQPQNRSGEPFPLSVGSRVRVAAPTIAGERLEGSVTGVSEESLTVSTGDRVVRVPRDAVTQLEVSTGRHRHVWQGLAIGAAAGAVAGGASGCFPMVGCGGNGDQHLAGAALGAVGFAGWGALIGAFVRTEHWQPVPVGRVHVAVAPARGGGFALRVACSF